MNELFREITAKLKHVQPTIVFPEGVDERILEAVSILVSEKIVKPLIVGEERIVKARAEDLGFSLEGVEIINPYTYEGFEEMVQAFVERRKGKETEEEARRILKDGNYFGTMLVYTEKADGLVSGAIHSTGETVRPALQIIKTKEGVKKTSGAFLMMKGNEKYIFSDCAINIAPDSSDLAETAIVSAETAQIFGIDPKIAMLSFSTKGSAKTPETEKAAEAASLAKERAPELLLDGEFQFDAAFVPEVAMKKAPNSPLKGEANVFVFPSLEAGNIGYKLVQRLGGYEAIGPILQGLNKPVNDLSRGCSAEDVYKLSLITAMQALSRRGIYQ